MAFQTGSLGPFGRRVLRIESRTTFQARHAVVSVRAREDVATRRTEDLHLGLSVRIGVACNDPRGEEIDGRSALDACGLHYPKEVEHVTGSSLVVLGSVKRLDLLPHPCGKVFEGIQQGRLLHGSKRRAHRLYRNRVDVSP